MQTLDLLPKSLPFKFVLKLILVIALGVSVSVLLIYYSGQVFLGDSYSESIKTLHMANRILLRNSIIIYVFTAVLIMGGIAFLSLFYSHKIAGPVYRLSVSARKIAGGDLTVHVKLRDGDAIHPLARALNDMTEAYRRRVREILKGIDELKMVTEVIERSSGSPGDIDISGSVDELIEKAERLKEGLRQIRL